MSLRIKIAFIVGFLLFVLIVNNVPFEKESSGITEVLYGWGESQEEIANATTEYAVSGTEGTVVGEHKIDGSNWSIPNILRHLLSGGEIK